MNGETVRPLRVHFARHNRRVIGLVLLTALGALAFWALLYFVCYWLLLLVLTVAEPMETRMPPQFASVFAVSAIVLCALGLLARSERPRDRKSAWEVALDLVLTVPRMTLAVGDNLRAVQWLNRQELELASRLLETLAITGRLALHQTPLEIPDEKARIKIMFALQISGVVEVRQFKGELTLVLHGSHAQALAERRVRIVARS